MTARYAPGKVILTHGELRVRSNLAGSLNTKHDVALPEAEELVPLKDSGKRRGSCMNAAPKKLEALKERHARTTVRVRYDPETHEVRIALPATLGGTLSGQETLRWRCWAARPAGSSCASMMPRHWEGGGRRRPSGKWPSPSTHEFDVQAVSHRPETWQHAWDPTAWPGPLTCCSFWPFGRHPVHVANRTKPPAWGKTASVGSSGLQRGPAGPARRALPADGLRPHLGGDDPRYLPFQPQDREGIWYDLHPQDSSVATGIGIGPVGHQAVTAVHHMGAALLAQGLNVIADVLLMESAWFDEARCLWQPSVADNFSLRLSQWRKRVYQDV